MSTPRIYLDNCSLNRPFDNQEQMKIRLETEAKLYIQYFITTDKQLLKKALTTIKVINPIAFVVEAEN